MNLLVELKKGSTILLSNKEHQFNIGKDDIRIARLELEQDNTHTWVNGFKIWFNGELLHSSKTFKSFEKRLNILIEKWDLKQTEIELA